MMVKWSFFAGAAFLAGYFLISRGIPVFAVLAGCGLAALATGANYRAPSRQGLIWNPMHEALPLPLAMLIVFGSAKLLAEICERLGQPGLVGEILAGALVGPSALGWITPNDTLKALSDLGVMFLLFGVGLEVKASEVLKVGAKATLVAILGVIVPFFAGWGIMSAWGVPQVEAIFVGASMVATSVGITASVLSAKRLLHEVASQIILAAAVIDDVLGLIVLAAVSSVARGRVNFWELALTASLATAFTVVMDCGEPEPPIA